MSEVNSGLLKRDCKYRTPGKKKIEEGLFRKRRDRDIANWGGGEKAEKG